jgi:hydrogenase maturation factor
MTAAYSCHGDHCITCSDEGLPMRVVAIDEPGLARCAAGDGAETLVMTDLVEPVAVGDLVLVHAGVALTVLPGEAVA